MMICQKTRHEFLNCSGCLLKYIPWPYLFFFTFVSGSIYYYLSMHFISTATTTKEAFQYYWSCPPTNNLLLVIAFYIAVFIPFIFVLRFLEYNICEEYYIPRLNEKKNFIFSKMFCVCAIILSNLFLRLLLFILYTKLIYNYMIIEVKLLLLGLGLLAIVYITFNFLALLFYVFFKNATIIFVILSVFFFCSVYLMELRLPYIFFWIYGLNFYNITVSLLCGDIFLLVLTMAVLLIRYYDYLPKEEEKNE